jgi:hypothetical protein
MTAAQMRVQALLATIILKMLEPHLQQYGVSLSLDDVLDGFILVTGAWHYVMPYIQRFIPPMKPVEPAKVDPK